MRIIDDLFEEGLLIEVGQVQRGVGRKRSLIAYNKDAYTIIGIDLGGTKLYGALSNIGGDLLHEITLQHHGTTGEESFTLVLDMIETFLGGMRTH